MGTYNGNHKGQAPNILKLGKYGCRGFTRILNEPLNDERLGGLALGVLTYALSKPSNWKLHSWQLAKRFHRGRGGHAIGVAMKQLSDAGYARLRYERVKGRIKRRYWQVRESPELSWPNESKKLHHDFHDEENHDQENCHDYKRKSFTNERVVQTKERGKVAIAHRASRSRSDFVPKYPYPESEEEGYATLETEGVEIEPSYDGNFFQDMIDHDWMIDGEPVYDWKATYVARVQKILADRGDELYT